MGGVRVEHEELLAVDVDVHDPRLGVVLEKHLGLILFLLKLSPGSSFRVRCTVLGIAGDEVGAAPENDGNESLPAERSSREMGSVTAALPRDERIAVMAVFRLESRRRSFGGALL